MLALRAFQLCVGMKKQRIVKKILDVRIVMKWFRGLLQDRGIETTARLVYLANMSISAQALEPLLLHAVHGWSLEKFVLRKMMCKYAIIA